MPTYRIRNNRVVTKVIRGQRRYFLQMVRTKSHKKTMRRLHRIYEQVEYTVNKEKIATFEAEKKQLLEKLQAMQEASRVTFAHGRLYGEMLHDTKYHWPDAVTVWSACEMAWQSIEGLLFRNAKSVYFYQRDDFITIQGKQAERSIILKYDKKTNQFYVQHNGMAFPLITKSHDLFIKQGVKPRPSGRGGKPVSPLGLKFLWPMGSMPGGHRTVRWKLRPSGRGGFHRRNPIERAILHGTQQ